MRESTVLIVDDEPDMRWVLGRLLRDHGFAVREAEHGAAALDAVRDTPPDVVLSDIRMPEMDGVAMLRALAESKPDMPVILLSAVEDVDTAVGAMRDGAYDYLSKPFDADRLLATVRRAAERGALRREVATLKTRLARQKVGFGSSPAALELQRAIDLVAPQPTLSVLIQGESGTGKEVVAREIHRRSPAASGPFVAVDCGALPEPLMESQLFGHKKGAFTGADSASPGLFRTAHGGTLFLDELGNLPLALQAKLLRTLQERVVAPVGGGEPVPFEARLLCATNAQLEDAIGAGAFRIDLYHRVAEFRVEIPPLRTRPTDLHHFVEQFLGEATAELGCQVTGLTAAAMAALEAHPWPGNLRELRNAVRRAVLVCGGREIDVADLGLHGPGTSDGVTSATSGSLADRVRAATEQLEGRLLREALAEAGGNKTAAARALQIDVTTLYRKLRRHGI